jgi:Family of unknown function (DUF6879)
MIITPRSPDYWRVFDGFQHTAFRWEGRQDYEDEPEPLRCFLAGEPKPPMPGKERWVARVQAACAAGKVMARVHGVCEPLTPYLRYELQWSYPPNVAAGEDVRIARTAAAPPVRDFWLFDSTALLWLDYDASGCLVSTELDDNPASIVQANHWRDVAMHTAVPLDDFMRENILAA